MLFRSLLAEVGGEPGDVELPHERGTEGGEQEAPEAAGAQERGPGCGCIHGGGGVLGDVGPNARKIDNSGIVCHTGVYPVNSERQEK